MQLQEGKANKTLSNRSDRIPRECVMSDHCYPYAPKLLPLCDSFCHFHNEYRTTYGFEYSVCLTKELETLLVSSHRLSEIHVVLKKRWPMALSSIQSQWLEKQNVLDFFACEDKRFWDMIFCTFNNSRSLKIDCKSEYLRQLGAKGSRHKLFVHRIDIIKDFIWFSTTCGGDSLIAISYSTKKTLRMYRVREDWLMVFAGCKLQTPYYFLLVNQLIANDSNGLAHSKIEKLTNYSKIEQGSNIKHSHGKSACADCDLWLTRPKIMLKPQDTFYSICSSSRRLI